MTTLIALLVSLIAALTMSPAQAPQPVLATLHGTPTLPNGRRQTPRRLAVRPQRPRRVLRPSSWGRTLHAALLGALLIGAGHAGLGIGSGPGAVITASAPAAQVQWSARVSGRPGLERAFTPAAGIGHPGLERVAAPGA